MLVIDVCFWEVVVLIFEQKRWSQDSVLADSLGSVISHIGDVGHLGFIFPPFMVVSYRAMLLADHLGTHCGCDANNNIILRISDSNI